MAEKSDLKDSPAALALAYGRIAKSLYGIGERSLALDLLDRGIKKFPDVSGIYISKGELLVSVYNSESKPDFLKAALISFERALKLDPQNYLARLLAGQIYLKAGKSARATELVNGILETNPDDERALSLLNSIKERESKAAAAEKAKAPAAPPVETREEPPPPPAPPPAAPAEPEKETAPSMETPRTQTEELGEPGEEGHGEEEGEVVVTQPNSSAWSLDEKVVIGAHESDETEMAHDEMAAKLTLFSKLEGLMAIFLLDQNGQPIKIINKAKLDVNIAPSLIFNLYNASVNGIRRTGLGSFQRGFLVTPIGTFIIANAFYATLGVVVDNDANMTVVEARIQRYLEDIAS